MPRGFTRVKSLLMCFDKAQNTRIFFRRCMYPTNNNEQFKLQIQWKQRKFHCATKVQSESSYFIAGYNTSGRAIASPVVVPRPAALTATRLESRVPCAKI